jgi:hypothetical protein
MAIDLSYIIISGKRLDKLVDFLFEISDRIDLVCTDYKEMTRQEYETALKESVLQRYDLDRSNGLSEVEIAEIYGETSAEEGLSGLSADKRLQELESRKRMKEAIDKENLARENSYLKSAEDINVIINQKFNGLNCNQRVVTSKTHSTHGAPCVVYTFPASEKLQELFKKMELLTWPLRNEVSEILAEDPAFYSEGTLICSICSHEGYVTLYLTPAQTKEFYSLGIPFSNRMSEDIPTYPYLKDSVHVLSLDGTITTLLGLGVYNYDLNSPEDFLQFYHWFDEHVNNLRKEVKPCRKYVEEIIEYLQQKYSMEPYHSEVIEKQCKRHGWDSFYYSPRAAENDIIEDSDYCPPNTYSPCTTPDLAPFLFRISYEGDELLVGGEYNSDYIFVDLPKVEEDLRDLLENIDKRVCAVSGRGSMTESLFNLLKEINIVRGIDAYEKYNYNFFRSYMQILLYENWLSYK